ncbi:MAG: C69 family dipeptidase [Candidatus Heimdallarchaeaceae archaeon]
MCDTVVAVGSATKDKSVIFGKNSDRLPNEAHNIEFIAGKKHKANSKVKCTHISVPQVEQTYTVLLSKPYWMYGCEMGANEYGVTMGNEAVWSKEPIRDTGLLGMDLMRLALERSKTAKSALETITSLLEKYGQGGQCSYPLIGRDYHNSFIIADAKEAWVLETADKFWIAEKVKNIRTISNTLSIGNEYDLIHPDLINHAIEKGYTSSEEDFHFANNFIPKFRFYHALKESSPRSQFFAGGSARQQCTTTLLLRNKGKITPEDVMGVLRNHNIPPEEEKTWSPSKIKANSPCRHAKGIALPDQSTSSQVSHIKKDVQVHWVTGSSGVCMSTFKPIFLPKPGLKKKLKLSDVFFDADAFWWLNEKFQRLVSLDYQKRLNVFREDKEKLEKDFLKKVQDMMKEVKTKPTEADLKKMAKITTDAFTKSIKNVKKWTKDIEKLPIDKQTNFIYRSYWNNQNKKAKLE